MREEEILMEEELYLRRQLLKIAVGEEKMPEEGEARERWIEKNAVLFDLILQSVNKEMFEHIKDLVEADDSGPRAWKLLRDKLVKDGSLKGLEVKGGVKEIGSCPTCLETKFFKFPFNSTTGPAKSPLALVHMDVVGPTRAPSLSGSRYFLTIVDDHTRAVWVYPLKSKGEVAAAVLKEWMPRAQRACGHKA
ncbi:hypothetical protein CLOM_g2565 [Closterium sp. NIES-68]|nr:hypothetical protein CLOM_g2565 [Closterium sp. NIES-68]